MTALTTLAEIFKNKFQKAQITGLLTAPAKVAERTFPAESSNPILDSPVPLPRQTRSQTKIHAQNITSVPLLPRVVTPMMSRPAPTRVRMRSQNLSPQNLSQNDFAAWILPTWPSPWEIGIGPSSNKPMQSFTPSLENKWNTWPL
jgi:hypothetical protein